MRNTTLCYIEQDGQYLMLHRVKKQHDLNHDKWIGIGGKFEPGESPEDCLLREAREETGLTLTQWRYRGIVTFVSDQAETEYMHLFTATGFEGQMKVCDEGDLEWIAKDRLLALTLWEGDKIFLRLLDREAPFFSLKLVYTGDRLTQAALDGVPIGLSADALPATAAAQKEPLLVSACLLGAACRYDGQSKPLPQIEALQNRYQLIPVCPEQLGGLPTPRIAAEREPGRVITRDWRDVTAAYETGAAETLRLARLLGCTKALLKERSPSCGHGQIYDGTFTGHLVPGDGVTAQLLLAHNMTVYGESRWEALL